MSTGLDPEQQIGRAVSAGELSESAAKRIRLWLVEPPFVEYRDRLVEDIEAGRWSALNDAFFAVLEFGTGGRRGRMYPVGTNVLNSRTMAESARGLADYITTRKGADAERSVAIAYDVRHNSRAFAERCARVLAAAGFKVYLCLEPRSTPLLSFAVRHLHCDGGIMITASHNAPPDNGFKCYAPTGGQVIPPDDAGIIACVEAASERAIPEVPMGQAIKEGKIVMVGAELDEAFIEAVVETSVSQARDLSIVYTPLHGVGASACAEALKAAGFQQVNILASQREPSGDFPNVPGHVSNPEIPKTMDAAITEAQSTGADLVIASDPDADRIGMAVPATGDPKGPWTTFTGNQIGAMLAAFVVRQTKAAGKLRPDHYLVTTLVTTQMARALANRDGVRTEDNLLVGFKWIGQKIDNDPSGPTGFLFGFEESHGYLKGTHVRDKDAAVAALLVAELAAETKAQGKTVPEYLDDLYMEVGHYGEDLINIPLAEGPKGLEQVADVMGAFRERPPKQVAGFDVAEVHDYETQTVHKPGSAAPPMPMSNAPSGNLLIFHLNAPGLRFAARPSGTEPKIKFYLFAYNETNGLDDREPIADVKQKTAGQLKQMGQDIQEFVRSIVAT